MTETDTGELMTAAEAAKYFGVGVATVRRWAAQKDPKLRPLRTPGGHLRFLAEDVYNLGSGKEGNVSAS